MSHKDTPIRLLVGLGNPEDKYLATRHNVGFWYIDRLAEKYAITLRPESRFQSLLGTGLIEGQRVWLQKPFTYMNHSGRAVAALMNYYKIAPEEMLVAHDDLDLPAGTVKLKKGGGHGGHNGLRDIIACLGSKDFVRLRIGIGHPGHKNQVLNWVLSKPASDDRIAIEQAIERAVEVTPWLVQGKLSQATTHLHSNNPAVKAPGYSQ